MSIDTMIAFFRERTHGVLATSNRDLPHCSLMAFLPEEDGRFFYLVTRAGTTKYDNLVHNPRVSFLVDDRDEAAREGRLVARALTVAGRVLGVAAGADRSDLMARFLVRHPTLAELARHRAAVLVTVRMESLQWLEGPLAAEYEILPVDGGETALNGGGAL
jgi:uncharacterized pyridoxamine 5'-phosphate oxidase family protein